MKYIHDIEWLLRHKPDATEKDKDMFIDKVAFCIYHDNQTEEKARKQVLQWMEERNGKL